MLAAAALAFVQPAALPPEPVVALVEMDRHVGDGDLLGYRSADLAPDEPAYQFVMRNRVRPVAQFSGPRMRDEVTLEWVSGHAFIRGVVFLVVAEPSLRLEGLFARWWTASQDGRGRYCVPEAVLTQLGSRRGLRAGARWRDGDQPMRCFSSVNVSVD